jgi:hypothetical protein
MPEREARKPAATEVAAGGTTVATGVGADEGVDSRQREGSSSLFGRGGGDGFVGE